MVFGFTITPLMMLFGGGLLLLLVVFQVLVGSRRIRFKGPLHAKVHRWGGRTILVVALFHGFAGLVFALGLRIG